MRCEKDSGERKQLFEELLVLGIKPALVARDYYCRQGSKGREFRSQYEVGLQYRYSNGRYVSVLLNALHYYLDPTFCTSEQAMGTAAMIARRVAKLSARAERDKERAIKKAGYKKPEKQEEGIPKGLPKQQREAYELVREAEQKGILDILKECAPKRYDALVLCFGVTTGKYVSTRKAAGVLHCTGQNVWLRVKGARQFIKKQLAEKQEN